MKHHFADFLDREGGYWTITPNHERYRQGIADVPDGSPEVVVATIGKATPNWERVFDFPNLEELTLHEPSQEQFAAVGRARSVRRLRVTHHRAKTIEPLAEAAGVEELILEYLSGFSDLSPLRQLPKLRSLYIENLRKVECFDGLAGCSALQYLSIRGTADWDQPIRDLDFVAGLPALEVLAAHMVRVIAKPPTALPIARAKSLRRLRMHNQLLSAQDHAILEVGLPHVDGTQFGPWEIWFENYFDVDEHDPRLAAARAAGHGVVKRYNGKYGVPDPDSGWFQPTGRGARRFRQNGSKANDEKCRSVAARYDELKAEARRLLGTAN
ncbi:MAG: leucine-rich repeat domain-containing protein [Planctomycetes bacterium]|nr:leucine-rich repeat domain-containing protein [Planctomycetota bacterium]